MEVIEEPRVHPSALDGRGWLAAYERMLEIRRFEELVERLFYTGEIRGSTHLAIGQEAIPVGARLALADGDLVAPTYRGHGWALAWGIPLDEAFAELLGRDAGCNRGRGGSKHLGSFARGVVVSNAIVAANLPIACGLALAAKQDGRATVTLAAFGDGATNQAVFHEALNLAVIWRLPVIFVCENNQYSEMTPIRAMVGVERLVDRVRGYGIATATCDGMDVEAVRAAVAEAAERARTGGGPTFVEAETYRFCGHMPGDAETYRTREEVEAWRARDPLAIARTRLAALGVGEVEAAAVADAVERRVNAALDAARAAPAPDPAALALGTSWFMEVTR
jgi:TPP-dependent pyruvate/acetoin dehydrogenase alpha subunit